MGTIGFLGMELAGKKLGIIGMGRIGQSFAKRAQAFGLKVYYHNRTKLPSSIEEPLQATYVEDLDNLLRTSDVLSLHCPYYKKVPIISSMLVV